MPSPVALRQCTHPAGEATAVFDECVRECRTLFGAVRVADLEIEGRYRSDVHDPWFDAFDWARFSDAERALLPAVIALDTTERLTGTDMAAFSRMLRSKRSVHVFVSLRPDGLPADPSAAPLELGYVAISHREACVHQGSVAAPLELAAGFAAALERPRPAVHLIDTGSPTAAVGQWLSAASALEGRAHPVFRYDPDGGSSWSARFRLDGNPQPERDWPAYPSPEDEAPGDVSMTFADHALLVSERTDAFRVVPDDVPEEDLVPLADALDASDAHAERVPFVVGVDGNGRATRLAVSHALLLETRRRRDFWHTLQELGGIHNAYVEAASRQVRADVEAAAAADLEKRLAAHEAEIERTRTDAARDAMAALARTLLGLDAGVALTRTSPAPGAPRSATVATPPPPPTRRSPPPTPRRSRKRRRRRSSKTPGSTRPSARAATTVRPSIPACSSTTGTSRP